jgi:hypothetical protein
MEHYENNYHDEEGFDLSAAWKNSPNTAPYKDALEIIESYEDEDILNDFTTQFPEGEPVTKQAYEAFTTPLVDDSADYQYIAANWVSMFDPEIYTKANL